MPETMRCVTSALLSGGLLFTTGTTVLAAEPQPFEPPLEAALPKADAGECYGKVLVPARYSEETVEVTVREASERFALTPARFEAATETVTLRDGATTIVAHQPVHSTEIIEVMRRPAGSSWVRGGLSGEQPPSEHEVQALQGDGIDIDSVQPGQCALEYYKAEVMRKESMEILVHEASEELDVVDAQFRNEQLPVTLVPAHGRLVEIPAIWRDDEMEVIVESARTAWKPGTGPIQRIDNLTGEILCRVDIPAVTDTIAYQRLETPALVTRIDQAASEERVETERLVSDARTNRRAIPARFDTLDVTDVEAPGSYRWSLDDATPEAGFEPTGRRICLRETAPEILSYERGVVSKPGHFEHTAQPAHMRDIVVQRLVVDASFDTVPVEAVMHTLTQRKLESEARVEWQPVLCETNVTPEVIRRLQSALEEKGFSPNGIDGLLGPGTLRAVERLQRSASLSTGGLTIATFEHLGVALHTSRPEDDAALSASIEEP